MPRIYYIHDNGDRPYKVVVNNYIYVYQDDGYIDDNGEYVNEYPKLIYVIKKYNKLFVGKSDGKFGNGNSLLIRIDDNNYIYIGVEIYYFKTVDKITKYFSPIGNSDVPYPYAIGKKYTYLMSEYVKVENINLQTNDPYIHYYNHSKKFDISSFDKFNYKIIIDRLIDSKEYRQGFKNKLKEYNKRMKLLNKKS